MVTQRNGSKAVDVAELNRVFDLKHKGTPAETSPSAPRNIDPVQVDNHSELAYLKRENELLREQLRHAHEHETQLMGMLREPPHKSPKHS